MKKIFKSLIMSCAITGLTLPIVGCSKNSEQIKTIEIVSDLNDLTIMEDEAHLTKPIKAKCYDSGGKEIETNIKFSLKIEGNDQLPNWICLTENNEIEITGGKESGSYMFNVIAFNEEEQIYSKTKSFIINVIDERHIVPDSIEMSIEDGKTCMYGVCTKLPITITPFKKDVDEKYLIKSCVFELKILSEIKQDLNGQPLFKLSESNIDPVLIISKDTDQTFVAEHKLQINAFIEGEPTINVTREITINIANPLIYYDENSHYVYSRVNEDDDWTLSLAESRTRSLNKILPTIQNKPVTKITDNFCGKSGIENLCEVILPDTIKTIGSEAFSDQKSLTLLSMPGVNKVDDRAFYNCFNMELSINEPEPILTTVGNYAFNLCTKFKLTSLEEVTTIGTAAFYQTGIVEMTVGKNCTRVGNQAFQSCGSLEMFTILALTPPTVYSTSFRECYKLSVIYVPSESYAEYNDSSWSITGKTLEGI